MLACLYTLSVAQAVFIPIVAALILNTLLSPLVRAVGRFRCPEPISAFLVLGTLVGILAAGAYLLVDPASEWVAKAPSALQTVERKAADVKRSLKRMTQATAALEKMADFDKTGSSRQVEVKGPSIGVTVIQLTKEFLATVVTTLILVYFLLAGGDFFLEKLVKVLPTLSDKKRAVDIVRQIERSVSHYLSSVTLINTGVGLAVGVAMAALGMPNPVLWGPPPRSCTSSRMSEA